MLPRLALALTLALLVSPRVAPAQEPPPGDAQLQATPQQYDTPAYVAVVDGTATLERDGRIENAPLNMPLLSGDRLRTADGRVEVRFADGGRLHLDSRTSLDVQSDDLVRLVDGRIRLSIQRAPQVSYRVDSAVGSVRLTEAGEYRVSLIHTEKETQLELAVVRGAGEIFTEQGATPVRSGERAYASLGLLPSYAYTYNSANMDEFDRWSDLQRGAVYAPSSESSQYLPADMTGYASTFDQYGDWRYQQTYGYVWYPRVATGWRPYYYGRWAPYPVYGWTWIAGDPFGYPTHHYGRWGFSANSWFWIPTPYWGPAYVSWGYAPNYVSWCPLGFNNRAVFSINSYNVGPAYYHGHYTAAWTTVPRGSFGHGYYAHQNAVNWDRAGSTGARVRLTEDRAGPARDVAIPRNTAPVRFAGTRTVMNTGAPAVGRNGPAGREIPGGVPVRADGRQNPAMDRRAGPPAGVEAVRAQPGGTSTLTDTPRYINRGNEIIRSQTGRPIAPNDTAVPRTAPQGTPSAPVPTRPSPQGTPSSPVPMPSAPARLPSIPRGPGGSEDTMAARTAPPANDSRYRADDRAVPRMYDRPNAGDRVYAQPSIGDRAYVRPSPGAPVYDRPTVGDRAYERPGGRPMERAAPPPSAPAPSAPPASAPPSHSGAERAVPRSGPAPQSAPARSSGSATSSGHRGGGRR